MNGIYKVSLSTPLGMKSGTLVFTEEQGVQNGYISAMGSKSPFQNAKVSGNYFEFSGTLRVLFRAFQYTAKGTIDGDKLSAVASTQYGNMKIEGTRQG